MPEVQITFKLPEENDEHRLCMKAGDLASIIYDFTQLCREKTKYGDGKPVSWEDVRTAWWEVLNEYKFDPYEA